MGNLFKFLYILRYKSQDGETETILVWDPMDRMWYAGIIDGIICVDTTPYVTDDYGELVAVNQLTDGAELLHSGSPQD